MKLFILIPVYNEAVNLDLLHSNLLNILPVENKSYIFVDDGSTDTTIADIHKLFQGSEYQIIQKPQNEGPGDSFNRGFNWILEHSAHDDDIIVTMEGDNTSDLSILPDMVSISRMGYDMVLASVYAQGGGLEQTNLFRILISFFGNLAVRLLLGINVLTLSSFYRVYSKNILVKIKGNFGEIINEKGFISMVEVLYKAAKLKTKMIEVPMFLYSSRRKGKSKMKVMKTMASYVRFLWTVKKRVKVAIN